MSTQTRGVGSLQGGASRGIGFARGMEPKKFLDTLFEPFGLVDGDILFRWVPRRIGQRKLIQGLITGAQVRQMTTQYEHGLDSSAVEQSAMLIQHVGIYTGGGFVREVDSQNLRGDLYRNNITDRKHYDLVVRSRGFGEKIAHFARHAIADRRQILYPIWDLLVCFSPTRGYGARNTAALNKAELRVHRGNSSPFRLKQAVVCSHFVHAVLYAAVTPGGTLRTATDHEWDNIFKISPSHMWTEFLNHKGVWASLNAEYVGLQHRGVLRAPDPRRLGVGLGASPAAA